MMPDNGHLSRGEYVMKPPVRSLVPEKPYQLEEIAPGVTRRRLYPGGKAGPEGMAAGDVAVRLKMAPSTLSTNLAGYWASTTAITSFTRSGRSRATTQPPKPPPCRRASWRI